MPTAHQQFVLRVCIYSVFTMPGPRIISKTELLILHRPEHQRRPQIYVRVSVERGIMSVEKCSRRCITIKPTTVNGEYDLKVVWVSDMTDDRFGHIRNSFVVITPEKSYIFQASTHKAKIEWMQALSIGISQCLRFRGSYRPTSWTNLEDLQKWLTIREVQYHYRSVEAYKGAMYMGKWHLGMPHGVGTMEWPNGCRYDGEFVRGKIEGAGTMLWISDPNTRSYTGSWKEGLMEGYGEMMYTDGSVYTGWWHEGMRYGHGRIEYKDPEAVYIGGWEKNMRQGYGVYHESANPLHYMGMWEDGQYHGPGILLKEDDFYSGMFQNGEKGSGSVAVLEQDDKWTPLFRWCAKFLEQMVSISHSNPDVSHISPEEEEQQIEHDLEEHEANLSIGVSPELGGSCQDCHSKTKTSDDQCVVCRIEGFKSATHPFGILVNNLTKCFIESYSGIAQHPKLLPHAIGELTSITTRLHQLVRKFCPTVIKHDESLIQGRPKSKLSLLLRVRVHRSPSNAASTNSSASGSTSTSAAHPRAAGDPTWLYPILLPSITDTLMGLYKVYGASEDRKLSETLRDLDEKEDEDLCELLELQSEYQNWEKSEREQTFSELFYPATQIFSKIGEYLTPLNKLLCIQEANAEITQIYKSLHPDRDSPFACSHEDEQATSSKLFSFVIVRSQAHITCLHSEIQFIQDFAGSVLNSEEYGYLLTQLKGCYHQLIELYVDEEEWELT